MSKAHTLARIASGLGATLLLATAFVGVGASPASAHSQLVSTSPADGAVLDAPPSEVRLTFDAPLLDDTDTISINDADGNVVSSIHPKPEGDSVAIPWPAGTKPGTYQVAYRVVCGDGHPVIGALILTINGSAPAASASAASASATVASAPASAPATTPAPAAASPAPSATLAAEPESTSSGSPLLMTLGVAVIVGGLVAVVVTLVMRRRTAG